MITIAIDAMGGDGSPKKIIDGINHHYKSTSDVFYKIYGDQEQISKFLPSTLNQKSFKIFDTKNIVKGTDTPLEAAKKIGRAHVRTPVTSQSRMPSSA